MPALQGPSHGSRKTANGPFVATRDFSRSKTCGRFAGPATKKFGNRNSLIVIFLGGFILDFNQDAPDLMEHALITAVIGGLITATELTLFVLPAVARLVLERPEHKRSWLQNWRNLLRRSSPGTGEREFAAET